MIGDQLRGRVEPQRIRDMFAGIAHRYDTANTVLSFGAHHRWRRALVEWSGVQPGARVLDCATGTGDLALLFADLVGPKGEVVGSDFCDEMLVVAREKARARGSDVRFELADVTKLPYPDDYFDICSIAFGIRNVGDPERGIAELARVTRSGGQVLILEFGEKQVPIWKQCFGAFQQHVLPRLGGLVTGQRQAYEYLQKSSRTFPCGEAFCQLMRDSTRFRSVEHRSLFGGIVYLYRGEID